MKSFGETLNEYLDGLDKDSEEYKKWMLIIEDVLRVRSENKTRWVEVDLSNKETPFLDLLSSEEAPGIGDS